MNKKKAMTFTSFLLKVAVVTMILCLPSVVLVPPFLTPSSPLDKSIVKQFLYDIDPTYPPVEGLTVDLYNSALTSVDSTVTDVGGYATFLDLTDQTYTIKWMWGGLEKSETVMVTCDSMVFELTNYLESKSGGGLRLAEVWG